MASAPASHPGRAVGSPGWPPPAVGARATETLGERPRPPSSPSPTWPTRTTTVEDSRRIDPILVAARPAAGCTCARPKARPGLVRGRLHERLGPAPSLAQVGACQ